MSDLHQDLMAELDRCEERGIAGPYLAQMWRYVLAAHEGNGSVPDENCDAVPYLPEGAVDLCPLSADSTVLDVGCLGGYGLFDLAWTRRRANRPVPRMIGLDIDPRSVALGKQMAAIWAPDLDVTFCEGSATAIPIGSGSCDLVLARLLLPYVRMSPAVSEIARVLRPGGRVLFQIHSFSYYWRNVTRGEGGYYLRPIISGTVLALTGVQPRHRLFAETALTPRILRRLCLPFGLETVWQGGFRRKPTLVARKRPENTTTIT